MGLDHQPLRLAGQTFSKGLALASRTEITYRLPAGVKRFKATAGIDDSVRDVGRVRLEISLDGKKMYDQPITGKQPPVDLDLRHQRGKTSFDFGRLRRRFRCGRFPQSR